jgi:hypothetical protein
MGARAALSRFGQFWTLRGPIASAERGKLFDYRDFRANSIMAEKWHCAIHANVMEYHHAVSRAFLTTSRQPYGGCQ